MNRQVTLSVSTLVAVVSTVMAVAALAFAATVALSGDSGDPPVEADRDTAIVSPSPQLSATSTPTATPSPAKTSTPSPTPVPPTPTPVPRVETAAPPTSPPAPTPTATPACLSGNEAAFYAADIGYLNGLVTQAIERRYMSYNMATFYVTPACATSCDRTWLDGTIRYMEQLLQTGPPPFNTGGFPQVPSNQCR